VKHILIFLALVTQSLCYAQDTIKVGNTTLVAHTLIDSLTIPWDLHWGGDGWLWFNERDGNIYRLNPDTKEIDHIFSVPGVFQSWDNSGAHAMALHPNFPLEPYIFTHYNYDAFGSQLVRWTYTASSKTLANPTLLLGKIGGNSSHNGSRIVFDEEGYLYLAMGDAFDALSAQDPNKLNGKILRMTETGEIPEDNPFPGSYTWSMGHRNPQGLVFGKDGKLYSSEHGDATDDEVNVIERGRNYGWPHVEGFCDQPSEMASCDSLDVREPLFEWTPTYAPGGMTYFDHPSIPEWRNSLIQTFLKEKRLTVLPLTDDGSAVKTAEVSDHLIQKYGRLRDVMVTPNGRLFICTSNEETNGQWVEKDSYDKIIELVNPDYDYPAFESELITTSEEVAAFPNPATGFVWVSLKSTHPKITVDVVSSSGDVVKETELNMVFPNLWQVDISELTSGVYTLICQSQDAKGTTKIVIP
jgi:aldose sugar dehydrogenase